MSKSTHLPGIAGAMSVSVTGSVTIDTGMRDLVSFTATQMTDVAANEESGITFVLVDQDPGTTRKVIVKSTKGGTAHATAGDSAVLFSWIAIGN